MLLAARQVRRLPSQMSTDGLAICMPHKTLEPRRRRRVVLLRQPGSAVGGRHQPRSARPTACCVAPSKRGTVDASGLISLACGRNGVTNQGLQVLAEICVSACLAFLAGVIANPVARPRLPSVDKL
jgi:hypothetical protein